MKIVKVLLLPVLITASLFADCEELVGEIKVAQEKADENLNKPDMFAAYQSMTNNYTIRYNECMNAQRHLELMESNEEIRLLIKDSIKNSSSSSYDSTSSTYVDPYQ